MPITIKGIGPRKGDPFVFENVPAIYDSQHDRGLFGLIIPKKFKEELKIKEPVGIPARLVKLDMSDGKPPITVRMQFLTPIYLDLGVSGGYITPVYYDIDEWDDVVLNDYGLNKLALAIDETGKLVLCPRVL